MPSPSPLTEWDPLSPQAIADLLRPSPARWWLSGGAALDLRLGRSIRPRANIDVSTTAQHLGNLVAALPAHCNAWVADGDTWIRLAEANEDADAHPILIRNENRDCWMMQVNVEDGTEDLWVYKRDPRLQLPWDRAVLDLDGIPTGAPEVQLLWKALRPRPEDEVDKAAVLPELSPEARAWWERAILTIHPHSTWSIHVRSPFAPAKASWNRPRR